MSGLRLSESTVERTTEEAGQRLGELWADGHTLGKAADWHWNHDAKGQTVAYVSIDATGVGIQGENAAQADGRMVWVGKVFNPRVAATEAFPKPHLPSARYQAGLTSLDELGEPLRRQAAQVGMDRAEQWVALSDCGSGVDDFMRVNFPRAVRIADFFHVAEHLSDLAKAWSLGDPEATQELSDRWCHKLKHEGGRAMLAELEGLDRGGRLGFGVGDLSSGEAVCGQPRGSDGLSELPSGGLADWVGSHRSGVQDGGQPAFEAERNALGLRRSRRGVPPAGLVRRRIQSMGRLLGTIHQLMPNPPTNRKDAHPC